jgi:hypothetical protein
VVVGHVGRRLRIPDYLRGTHELVGCMPREHEFEEGRLADLTAVRMPDIERPGARVASVDTAAVQSVVGKGYKARLWGVSDRSAAFLEDTSGREAPRRTGEAESQTANERSCHMRRPVRRYRFLE